MPLVFRQMRVRVCVCVCVHACLHYLIYQYLYTSWFVMTRNILEISKNVSIILYQMNALFWLLLRNDTCMCACGLVNKGWRQKQKYMAAHAFMKYWHTDEKYSYSL